MVKEAVNYFLLFGMVLSLSLLSLGCGGSGQPPKAGAQENSLSTHSSELYIASSVLWPDVGINVCWENPTTSNTTERAWVQSAVANTWASVSRVGFYGWEQCRSSFRGVRIRISDEGPHVKYLGMRLDGVSNGMVLNFTFMNWGQSCQSQREFCIRAIAVHEFGHALGFAHEQNRPDTPSHCTEPAQGSNGDMMIGAWDLESVMNYCNPNWNGNGQLSATDIEGVNAAYAVTCLDVCDERQTLCMQDGTEDCYSQWTRCSYDCWN